MFFRNNRRLFKSILSLFSCALILLSSIFIPEDAYAASKGVTNAKVVLRQKASTSAKALQTLYEGTEVSVLKTSSGWYKVRYGQFTGYVMAKYLDVQGAAASSSSSSSSSSAIFSASEMRI